MPESIDPKRLKLTNEAGTEGVLLGLRCRECGVTVFGSGTFCQSCTSDKLEAIEFGQRGTLYSYTVVRVPSAGWPGPVPYILGQVELPEGPQVLAEVVDTPVEDLAIGMEVELVLRVAGEGPESDKTGKMVYKWRPKKEANS
ncbi:MAG: OB-fold domain-containing protein [Chloroflexi bacterium]|nr:OB-fold domain-containing protein [Chloroflexota bacterium]